MKRPVVIALLTAALLLVLAGIGAIVFFTVQNEGFDVSLVSAAAEETKTVKVDAEKPVQLNVSNDAGDVTVVGSDENVVTVKAVKTGYASTQARAEEDLKKIKYEVKQNGNSVTVTYELGRISTRDVDTVDFVITIPENAVVEVRANMGDLDVSRIKGDVNLNTDFGSTNAQEIEGALSVESQSGSITTSQINAGSKNITLRTDFGEMNIEKASAQKVEIHSQSGAIKMQDVKVAAYLIASTDFGGISSDIPITVTGDIKEKHQVGTINGGGGELTIQTQSGDVSIKTGK